MIQNFETIKTNISFYRVTSDKSIAGPIKKKKIGLLEQADRVELFPLFQIRKSQFKTRHVGCNSLRFLVAMQRRLLVFFAAKSHEKKKITIVDLLCKQITTFVLD